jgi:hypothetical protein
MDFANRYKTEQAIVDEVPEAETIIIKSNKSTRRPAYYIRDDKDPNSGIKSKSVNRGIGSLKDSTEKPFKKLDQFLYCVLIGGSLHELSKNGKLTPILYNQLLLHYR